MRTPILLLALALAPACHKQAADDGRSAEQRQHAAKTDQAAKEGALREKADPRADLRKQEENLKRLERNAELDREAGNRVGAWAAEGDVKRTRKLIDKDRKAIAAGETKKPDRDEKREGVEGGKR